MTITEFKAAWNDMAILTPALSARKKIIKETMAYTRTVAKNSMIDVQVGNDAKKIAKRDRKVSKAGFIISGGKQVSKPGAAAFSRLGFIKRHIYFVADEFEGVCGPALLEGVKSKGAVEALEHGGAEQLALTKFKLGVPIKVNVTATYQSRPTMALAFEKAKKKKLPGLIANGIMREV